MKEKCYEVFISSPSDLAKERLKIKEIVENFNGDEDIALHAILWEKLCLPFQG